MPCQAYSLTTVGLNRNFISCENIRICHDCLVWIKNSVPKGNCSAKVMPNSDPEGQFSIRTSHGRFFSLHTLSVFIAFCYFKCETFTKILTETQSIFCSCGYNYIINLAQRLQLHVYIIGKIAIS